MSLVAVTPDISSAWVLLAPSGTRGAFRPSRTVGAATPHVRDAPTRQSARIFCCRGRRVDLVTVRAGRTSVLEDAPVKRARCQRRVGGRRHLERHDIVVAGCLSCPSARGQCIRCYKRVERINGGFTRRIRVDGYLWHVAPIRQREEFDGERPEGVTAEVVAGFKRDRLPEKL